MPYYVTAPIQSETLNNGNTSDSYVAFKGVNYVGRNAGLLYKMDADNTKDVSYMTVANPSGTNKMAYPECPAVYLTEEPIGMLLKTLPCTDILNLAGTDDLYSYNVSGGIPYINDPNMVVHLVDAAFWHGNYELNENSPGYLGSSPVTNHEFHFENVTPSLSFSGTTLEVPPFPEGVVDSYPYYVIIRDSTDSTKCHMIFCDQHMTIEKNESDTHEVLHMPGNYQMFTFTYEEPLNLFKEGRPVLENQSTGIDGTCDLGDMTNTAYILTCNFILKSADGATTWQGARPLNSTMLLIVDNLPARFINVYVTNPASSDMSITISGGIQMRDFTYVALPTISVDEGTNTNTEGDYPTVTFSGTCPADAEYVYISYADGDVSSADKLDYISLCNTLLASSAVNADSSFSITVDSKYHESILTSGTLTYDNVIPYDHFIVWCNSTGTLTAAISNVVHNECLSGDTLITMADGSVTMLQDLHVGDMVLSGDGTPTCVTKLKRDTWSSAHTYYTFSDGTVIDETYEHRFYNETQGFWQKLRLWNIGDKAKKVDGTLVELTHVETVKESAEQFGIWTESHDYYANGLLSGDIRANLRFLPDATIDKFIDMIASASAKDLMAELEEAKE